LVRNKTIERSRFGIRVSGFMGVGETDHPEKEESGSGATGRGLQPPGSRGDYRLRREAVHKKEEREEV